MSTHPTPSTPADTPAHPAPNTHDYRELLHGMILQGADLGRILHARAVAQADHPLPAQPGHPAPNAPPPPPDPIATLANAFDKTARTVRRCIMLARVLSQPPRPAPDPARQRAAARRQLIRAVEDRIERAREHDAPADPALHAEFRERLDAPDLEDDLAARPVADIITDICRDLGLAAPPGTHPWKRRTPADVADLCARAAAATPQPGPEPRQPGNAAAAPTPGPRAARQVATPSRQPGPAHAALPSDDPAGLLAAILRQPADAQPRWRSPPSG